MSRPPHAREKVLDAFQTLLIDTGARGATMDATARAAGVSKGGLLYHFGSKEALEDALYTRLRELVVDDIAAFLTADEWPVAAFLRSCVLDDDPLDHTFLAVSRLAHGGSDAAAAALAVVRSQWEDALRPHVVDDAALALVVLVSDGLWFNNALGGDTGATDSGTPTGADLDALIARVEQATRAPR